MYDRVPLAANARMDSDGRIASRGALAFQGAFLPGHRDRAVILVTNLPGCKCAEITMRLVSIKQPLMHAGVYIASPLGNPQPELMAATPR